ncbi:M14 family metallopeptidase [Aquimarina megaterium]|uniref:M14 family metallopeptidase n=1 Tax=Aquimarina megaterium TaxID=1443666 RepID=UPI00054EBC79|nr:M14 family metallopeptidase [Aquimarina megaterium]
MENNKIIIWCCLCWILVSCKVNTEKPYVNQGSVIFDTAFVSARLDSVRQIGENKYEAWVLPAYEPVNQSPWYAFGMQSNNEKEIFLTLHYGKYKHRYIPKISTDKKRWRSIPSDQVILDTVTGSATLQLQVSTQKIYIASQEIETSLDTYNWIKQFLQDFPEVKKQKVGVTSMATPLYMLTLEKGNNIDTVVLIARQHPPEIPGGTIGFKIFVETMFSEREVALQFRDKFNIIVFPLLNPDGVDHGYWRHNANGKDLNRDWVDFTQPETQLVKKTIETKVKQGQKIRFAIDFHTSYSGPYMLVLDSINEAKTAKVIPDWVTHIEKNSEFIVEQRRRSQGLPYAYNYFFNAFGAEAVTYEEGDETDRKVIKERAKVYAENLMRTLLMKQKNETFQN